MATAMIGEALGWTSGKTMKIAVIIAAGWFVICMLALLILHFMGFGPAERERPDD